MKESKDPYWWRFGEPEQSSSFSGNLAGKYLFFSASQELLVQLARNEINHHQFETAKVSQQDTAGDFVCCLYWHDDSRRHELNDRYKTNPNLRYRWWKSNADTRAGKYSKEYLEARKPEYQEDFHDLEVTQWRYMEDP